MLNRIATYIRGILVGIILIGMQKEQIPMIDGFGYTIQCVTGLIGFNGRQLKLIPISKSKHDVVLWICWVYDLMITLLSIEGLGNL